mgnify:CR=1 FL=1
MMIDTVKQCAFGALSYSIDDIAHRGRDRPPMVSMSKDGPYAVTDGIELLDTKMGDGASSSTCSTARPRAHASRSGQNRRDCRRHPRSKGAINPVTPRNHSTD